MGYVEIGDDVEIGACTTIDRGVYGPTVIGEGTKIDNQVQIGHNCRIGRHNLICSQVGLAGSCTTGDYVVMAGQVGVRDHVHIGHRAMLAAQAGISRDVPDDEQMFGTPASPAREEMQSIAIYNRLPELRSEIKALKAGSRDAASTTAPESRAGGRLMHSAATKNYSSLPRSPRLAEPIHRLSSRHRRASVCSPVGAAIRSSSPKRCVDRVTKCSASA